MQRVRTLAPLIVGAVLASACADSASLSTGPDLSASRAASATAAVSGNKLQCFDGTTDTQQNPGYGPYGGTCTLTMNGATLSNGTNAYSGVYVQNSNLDGKLLGDVNKLAFSYNGTGASGGSPRFSIPIDENGNGTTEAYAFIDTQGCNDGNANVGTLDAIGDATCTVWYGSLSYANWAAFVAANPTYRIATDALTFIIADQPGTFTITNVQLGRGPAKSRP